MNTYTNEVTIRRSRTGDAVDLGRLAQLDGTLYGGAPALVAEVGGRLLAALPLDGSRPFADPFRHTAQLVAMLQLRRNQENIEGGRRPPSQPPGSDLPPFSRLRRAVRRRRRYRAPASA